MTLPASGTITMSQINTELGRSSSANITLKDASTGVYAAINTNSPYYPNGSAPYAISEWYCYNHNAFAPLLITTAGTGTWTCPPGCTSILVECWGQGGAGGNASGVSGARGGGGAGGGYASRTLSVTPGVGYSYQIGGTRTPGAAGVNTFFNNTSTIVALAGGNGSNATSNIQAASASGVNFPQTGVTYYQGGNGNTGAGGGGAGSTGVGNNAVSASVAGAPKTEYGGAGGTRASTAGLNGNAGSVYGGAGGGGYANSSTLRSGGNGAQGLIRITNLTTCTPVTTTTTTTVGAGKTVSYFGDTAGCAGSSIQFIVNGSTICSGSSCSGTAFVPIGAFVEVYHTTGPKATGFCLNAFACIGSTDGGCEFSSDSQSGAGVTAYASYTVTSGSPSIIYLNAGAFA